MRYSYFRWGTIFGALFLAFAMNRYFPKYFEVVAPLIIVILVLLLTFYNRKEKSDLSSVCEAKERRGAVLSIFSGVALIILSFVWFVGAIWYAGAEASNMNSDIIFFPFVVLMVLGCIMLTAPARNWLRRLIGRGDKK